MPLTITAFYTFSPLQTIQSAHFNNNFSLIRGNFIPIDASSSSSVNSAYNLGSTNYYWKQLYVERKHIVASTSGSCTLNAANDVYLFTNTTDITATLGAVATNTNTSFTIKSKGTGKVYIHGTIDGQSFLVLQEVNGYVKIICDGTTEWHVIG